MLKLLKVKYKVVNIISSPYGVFAKPGDLIAMEGCLATNKNVSMALPYYQKYAKPLTVLEGLKCVYNHLLGY